jgi:putative membrane protein
MKHAVLLTTAAATALMLAACEKKATPPESAAESAPVAGATSPEVASDAATAAADTTAGPIEPVAGVDAAASSVPATATGASTAGGPESTEALVSGVALTDLYQIQAGKIAEAKAQSPAVKDYAKAMVADHSAMTNQMKHLFAATKVKVPTELGPRGKRMIEALNAAAPADFDKVYLNQLQSAQAAELTLLRVYADAGESTDLKPAAAKRIPKVQAHLDKVHELQAAQP